MKTDFFLSSETQYDMCSVGGLRRPGADTETGKVVHIIADLDVVTGTMPGFFFHILKTKKIYNQQIVRTALCHMHCK